MKTASDYIKQCEERALKNTPKFSKDDDGPFLDSTIQPICLKHSVEMDIFDETIPEWVCPFCLDECSPGTCYSWESAISGRTESDLWRGRVKGKPN
jgi:hypothetical protein